ncbi:outer membrane protein [Helicobacter baculiformis]|uniref:Outer membrane protein n=1 Tax=Helicobacter baculiformis TaxID=427351 RepID=A0ABV7ZHP5_9HELI|nr:outer membrane protein [Helicobacter baculiformis]
MASLSKCLSSAVSVVSLFGALALFSPLKAERNAAYLGAGFQWSYMTTKETYTGFLYANRRYDSNLWGFNAKAGYKQFFGSAKRFGLRYYFNFSYNAVGRFSGTGTLSNISYGVGTDMIYNFFVAKDYAMGGFLGFQLAGTSWVGTVMATRANFVSSLNLPGKPHESYFQLPLNVGFRTNFADKQSLEVGFLIPLIPAYYYKGSSGGRSASLLYHRDVSLYFNYVFDF